jgi:LysM repeat protein
VILQHYNAELQKQGRPSVSMKQVVQANPRINPDRIFAGQKIQLPVPDKKK